MRPIKLLRINPNTVFKENLYFLPPPDSNLLPTFCCRLMKQCLHRVHPFLPCCSMQEVLPIAEVSVRPSVCLSQLKLWQNERKFRRDSYTTWKVIHIHFRTHRMVGGGRPLLPEILGRRGRPSFKNGDFQSIFARSGSTVGASEKSSIITNRSSVRAFQWA